MDYYLISQSFDFSCEDIELIWPSLKEEIFRVCELFIPQIKVSTLKLPKWFNSEIKHLLSRMHTLKRKLKRYSNTTKLANLSSLDWNFRN